MCKKHIFLELYFSDMDVFAGIHLHNLYTNTTGLSDLSCLNNCFSAVQGELFRYPFDNQCVLREKIKMTH